MEPEPRLDLFSIPILIMSDTSTSSDDDTASRLFDAIAAANESNGGSIQFPDDVTERDRITDPMHVVRAYRAASERHTWLQTVESGDSGAATEEDKAWEVGDTCLATYSEDGLVYPAVIKAVKSWKRTCVVTFDGYGNEEEVGMDAMQAKDAVEKTSGVKKKSRKRKKHS